MNDLFNFKLEFGNRLRAQIEKKKMTQEDLAKKLTDKISETNEGNTKLINRNTIGSYVNGKTTPDLYKLILLAEILECDVDYLLGINKEKNISMKEMHEYTHLDIDCINSLHKNKDQANFINHVFQNENLEDITTRIHNISTLKMIVNTPTENFLTPYILKRLNTYYVKYISSIQTEFNKEGFTQFLIENFRYTNQDDIPKLIKDSIQPNEYENNFLLGCDRQIKNYLDNPLQRKNIEKEVFHKFLEFLSEFSYDYFSQITFNHIQEQKLQEAISNIVFEYIDKKVSYTLHTIKKNAMLTQEKK